MAGRHDTSRRTGLTLAERAALSRGELDRPAAATRGAPTGARHVWVVRLPGYPGKCPGLLAEWTRREHEGGEADQSAGWFGRVVYAVDEAGRVVLVEAWVAAEHLEPVR